MRQRKYFLNFRWNRLSLESCRDELGPKRIAGSTCSVSIEAVFQGSVEYSEIERNLVRLSLGLDKSDEAKVWLREDHGAGARSSPGGALTFRSLVSDEEPITFAPGLLTAAFKPTGESL